MTKRCFLLGMMGSGKSFWATRLAATLQLPVFDLDRLVEEHTGLSVPTLFDQLGEPGFRALERDALHRLTEYPAGLVSVGGGTPCFFDNMAWMNRHGLTLYLKVPSRVLAERLLGSITIRPLLKNWPEPEWPERLAEMERQRAPYYQQAQVVAIWPGSEAAFSAELELVVRAYFAEMVL